LLYPALTPADNSYFTWIDAEGRIHNTPKATSSDAVGQDKTRPQTDEEGSYLDESQLQQKLRQDQEDHRPFYIWVDDLGLVHSQEIPAVDTQHEDKEEKLERVSDHTFIPPLRVGESIRNSACCSAYRSFFSQMVTGNKPVNFSNPERSVPFSTSRGERPAWYFTLGNDGVEGDLYIRLRQNQDDAALIALDEAYQPLYYLPRLNFQQHPETWRQDAFRETVIHIKDYDVVRFILYFPRSVPSGVTAEVEWR